MLALQRSAGNRAVAGMISRQVTIGPSAGPKSELMAALAKHNVSGESDLRTWYTKSVSPKLVGRFGWARFSGYLTHPHAEYSFEVETPKPLDQLSYNELTEAVIRTMNIRIMSQRIERGHSALGNVKLLKRAGFPSAVKSSFDKVPVMKATDLPSKQVHLRHFVMGSWFRALPGVFKKATTLSTIERGDLLTRVGKLIVGLGHHSGKPNAPVAGDLAADSDTLAVILHDLVPNLNAGEGPENTLIGFLSHGLTELAFDIVKEGYTVDREDVSDLIEASIAAVAMVSNDSRQEWVAQTDPVEVFEAMLAAKVGPLDPVPPDQLSAVMHQFAYALGIDFMKRESGLATSLQQLKQPNLIAQLQKMFIPVGEKIYSLITKAQSGVDYTDLSKLLSDLEAASTNLVQLTKPAAKPTNV